MTLAAGTHLGPYEIVAPLGAGGMGEVYRAKDPRLGREVAIKVLPAEVSNDPERLHRFEQEARAASALSHPNILTLFDVGRQEDTNYIVTELLEGETIRERLGRAIPTREAIVIAIEAARGLAAAHAKGIIHRDLKPENLFVTQEGAVKILDFGLAKLLHSESPDALAEGTTLVGQTEAGMVMGTVGYMAPEQVRGESLDARADIFALGCVLYELLTGERAFRGATSVDTFSAILRDEPDALAPGARSERIPPALERIVRHCLEKNARDRFHSARDLAFNLESIAEQLADEHSGTRAVSAVSAVAPKSEPPAGRSRARILGALAAIAVAIAAVVAVLLSLRARPPAAPVKPSIAVLPFVNMSSDPEQDYFSDGLAEELLDSLARVPQLHVAGRTSSFSFKGKNEDLRQIGQKLNVSTVLEGSVRKSGDQLRVTAQLINVADGFHLWSQTYDRKLVNVFALQDEIAGAVVAALKVELFAGAKPSPTELRAVDPEAHDLYLLGRSLLSRGNDSDYRRALDAFEKAVAIDPGYAAAHAGLARSAFQVADRIGTSSADLAQGQRRALAESERALELDPDFAEGYTTRASLRRLIQWDWAGAEADYRKALALDPGDSRIHSGLAFLLGSLRRSPEAIALGTRGTELDPLSPNAWRTLGWTLEWAGEFAAAHRAWERGLEIYPEDDRTRHRLAFLRLREGDRVGALSEFERLRPGWLRLHGRILALDALGRRAESEPLLAELIANFSHNGAFQMAEIFAARGETDRAFEWLDRARTQRDSAMPTLAVAPSLAVLHDDPRFAALLRTMNLPDPG